MAQRLKRHSETLQFLSRAKPSVVKAVIQNCEKDLLDAICECSLNILKGTVSLKPHEYKRLVKHRNCLRDLTKKNIAQKQKRALLQKGGLLQALLAPVLAVLGDLLA